MSLLSQTTLTPCPRSPGLHWHRVPVFTDYADTAPLLSFYPRVPDIVSPLSLTTQTPCPRYPVQNRHPVPLVLDYADTVSTYDTVSPLTWTMLTLCSIHCLGLCWLRYHVRHSVPIVPIVSDYADSVTTYDTVSPLSRTMLTPLPWRTQCPHCLGLSWLRYHVGHSVPIVSDYCMLTPLPRRTQFPHCLGLHWHRVSVVLDNADTLSQ